MRQLKKRQLKKLKDKVVFQFGEFNADLYNRNKQKLKNTIVNFIAKEISSLTKYKIIPVKRKFNRYSKHYILKPYIPSKHNLGV